MLAEAERGMLVHCCCFVVNLVRGYTAARPLDAVYRLGQLSSPPVSETYPARFYAFRSPDIRVRRGELLRFIHLFVQFWESRFDVPPLSRPGCHGDTRAHAGGLAAVMHGRRVGEVRVPVFEADVDFVACLRHVLYWSNITQCSKSLFVFGKCGEIGKKSKK